MNLEAYERSGQRAYAALADSVAGILSAALAQRPDLRLQQIQKRAKEPDSLRKKLQELGAVDSFHIETEVKDLAGARVVLYTNSDVSSLVESQIIPDNFDVDWDWTRIHYPTRERNEAHELFVSNNYVVKLKDDRVVLPEYAGFSGMWCEVQVQTMLNHAWAEMAHDTIYKKPNLAGFGSDLMRHIETRMEAIMRDYIAPAGYAFQKVLIDFERLAAGRELFDRGELDATTTCADNNEVHDVLERFSTYVLPHYDDPAVVAAEIVETVVRAVAKAREVETIPIETPFGPMPGYTSFQVATLAASVLEYLRYHSVERTFIAVAELYAGASAPEEQKLWLASAKALSEHNLGVWEQVGPRVQTLLIEQVRGLSMERILEIRPVVLVVVREVLRVDVTGTSANYHTVTLHRGTVVASEELRRTRSAAIDVLVDLFRGATGDAERLEVAQALGAAWSMPTVADSSAELAADVLEDARRIVDFYTQTLCDHSYELRQQVEHDLLWLYRRNVDTDADDDGAEGRVGTNRRALVEAILAFRDRVNEDREFVIFKTLVGFQSVFPPAWDLPERGYEAEEEYRTREIEALVAEVSDESSDHWFERIQRCAATDSSDGATFPPFQKFLELLGQAQPELMLNYLERMDERFAPFLVFVLEGLAETRDWPRAEPIVRGWVDQGRHLAPIASCVRRIHRLDIGLLEEILSAAIRAGDDDAVLHVIFAASGRQEGAPLERLKPVLLSGVRYLEKREDARWVNALTHLPRPSESVLLQSLEEAEAHILLRGLIRCPRLEYGVEDLVAVLAEAWPQAVIEFLGDRLRRDPESIETRYDPIPFQLHGLQAPLAANVESLVEAARTWFDEDRALFEFRGGRLLAIAFPAFSERLETLLLERVRSEDPEEIAFVVGILRAYEGQAFLHPLCREIAAVTAPENAVLNAVSIILDSMGVTMGEFGQVAGLEERREEIRPWLEDPRERVRAFASRHLYGLDQRIASEQRRSEERIALGELEYGTPE